MCAIEGANPFDFTQNITIDISNIDNGKSYNLNGNEMAIGFFALFKYFVFIILLLLYAHFKKIDSTPFRTEV